MRTELLLILALVGISSAHFILNWPPNAGFDEDKETSSPCGGFTPTVSKSRPDVQVGRFAIQIQNVHPVGEWSFRGTINSEAPYNFTEIVPIVKTTGIGDFCLQYMSVPSEWAGNAGVIQVIDNSPDGILYQCAAVNFVSGSNLTTGSACTNASSFEATWTSLESLPGKGSSGSSAAASSSSAAAAAMMTAAVGLAGGLGLLAAGLAL